jgi:CheY-like chemotaxis protein
MRIILSPAIVAGDCCAQEASPAPVESRGKHVSCRFSGPSAAVFARGANFDCAGAHPPADEGVFAPENRTPARRKTTMSRVLLVNDHDHVRLELRLLLEALGHLVEEADDGLDGVSRALSWKPDAAIVALALPIIDGYVFARRMRELFGNAIRLIALAGPDQQARALDAGFDLFLPESTEPEAVRALFAARDIPAAILLARLSSQLSAFSSQPGRSAPDVLFG